MRKTALLVFCFLFAFLVWRFDLGRTAVVETALVVILVAVPVLVAHAVYPNWRETKAPARELVGFWLTASFLGLFPVLIKVFLWLRTRSVLAGGELLGGLAGLIYFVVTLLGTVGEPLLHYFPGLPALLGEQSGREEHLAAIGRVAGRSGARLRAVYVAPAEALGLGPIRFAGLGTTNLYLSEEVVETLSPAQVTFLVGTELWHVRHRDLWWNLAVYYAWLLFVALHVLLGWAAVAVVGGVTFSVLWPLASRLKQLAADAYAARLTGDVDAALSALAQLPTVTPGVPSQPRGWWALIRLLFSYEVPVGLRVRGLSRRLRPASSDAREPELRAWKREGVRFWVLQVLLLVAVAALLATPLSLYDRQVIGLLVTQVTYLVIAVVLYAPFTAFTLGYAYRMFLAPGEGAPVRRLPRWAVALPATLMVVSGATTWLAELSDPLLLDVALAVSAGVLAAGLVAGEIDAFRQGSAPAS